ncbi:MAG TPA: pyridine nucleotide-disulfide oxidoreductase, partial [Hyalangium sp.]|nr:pyridine nucleotide-disulfide oxidoreductase [Hyalangium sp.]
MRAPTALPNDSSPKLTLGLPGFTFEDLYRPRGLRRLSERFDAWLTEHEPELFQVFDAYRKSGGSNLSGAIESNVLIRVSRHVARFLACLFNIESEQEDLARRLTGELPLFDFKRDFITRRVFKKGAPDRPTLAEFPSLDARMRLLLQLGFPEASSLEDLERSLAESILTLMDLERLFSGALPAEQQPRAAALRERWTALRTALLSTPEGRDAFGSSLVTTGDDAAELQSVRALLSLADRWTFARALHPQLKELFHTWTTHRLPKPLVFDQLVQLHRPDPNLPEIAESPEHHLRHRDG